jgi:YVTN family beta-propeller protein
VSVVFSPDGSRVYVVSERSNDLSVLTPAEN